MVALARSASVMTSSIVNASSYSNSMDTSCIISTNTNCTITTTISYSNSWGTISCTNICTNNSYTIVGVNISISITSGIITSIRVISADSTIYTKISDSRVGSNTFGV